MLYLNIVLSKQDEGDFRGLPAVMFSYIWSLWITWALERSQQLHPSPTSLLKDLHCVKVVYLASYIWNFAVQSMKVPREPILISEKWRRKFFSALCAGGSALRTSMHCLRRRGIGTEPPFSNRGSATVDDFMLICVNHHERFMQYRRDWLIRTYSY